MHLVLLELQYLGKAEEKDGSPGLPVHLAGQLKEVLQSTLHQAVRVGGEGCVCVSGVCVCVCVSW